MARAEVTRVGAVDIGTNTARLLIADVAAGSVTWVERRVRVTGLGAGVDATGTLNADAVDRTVGTLAGYGGLLRHFGVAAAAAVATSATRDAADRDGFLDRAALALGVRPQVIDGDEEAALSFRGAVHDLDAPAPYLVIDPGGGSTEFVLGTQGPAYTVSVDIGSVRLTDRCLPRHPALETDLAAAREEARSLFASVDLPVRAATVIGSGGTFTALAAIVLDQAEYDPDGVHRCTMTSADLDMLVDRLAQLSVPETAEIPSLDPARAAVLLGGAVVARGAARAVGASSLVISENDLLAGMALALAG